MQKRILSLVLIIVIIFGNTSVFATNLQNDIDGALSIDVNKTEDITIFNLSNIKNLTNTKSLLNREFIASKQDIENKLISNDYDYTFTIWFDDKYKVGENEYSIPQTEIKNIPVYTELKKDGILIPVKDYNEHMQHWKYDDEPELMRAFEFNWYDANTMEEFDFWELATYPIIDYNSYDYYFINDFHTENPFNSIKSAIGIASFNNKNNKYFYSNEVKINILPAAPTGLSINKKCINTTYLNKKLIISSTVFPKRVFDKYGLIEEDALKYKDRIVKWSSSNSKIATVKAKNVTEAKAINNAIITTKGFGTCYITATTTNGKQVSCKLTIKKVTPTKIKLNRKKLVIKYNRKIKLKPTIYPKNASNKKVIYKSSNKKIATVNSKGIIKGGKKKGTCTITAKTINGKKTICKVTVKKNHKHLKIKVGGKSYKAGRNSVYGPALNQKELNQVKKKVQKFIDKYIYEDMNKKERLDKALWYLQITCCYAPTWEKHRANTAWGALVYHQAQCSGYARALKALCDAMNVKCYYVHADNCSHQWNVCKVNGHWAHYEPQAGPQYGLSDKEWRRMTGMTWGKKTPVPKCPKVK